MKEVNEIWQMKIFDLLEGNLSEKEKQKVLLQIEKDEALKQEYVMMKKTYLEPESFVFSDKNSLYKKQGGGFAFILNNRFAAAASIAILFGSLSIFYFLNRNAKDTNDSLSNTQNVESKLNAKSPLISSQKQQKVDLNNIRIGHHLNVANSSDKIKNKIEIQDAIPAPITPKMASFYDNSDSTKTNSVANISTPDEPIAYDTAIAIDAYAPRIDYRKKRSLAYKLLNSGRQMIANLQMPKVNFKSEKRNDHLLPRVKMQISTPKTEIIATLID